MKYLPLIGAAALALVSACKMPERDPRVVGTRRTYEISATGKGIHTLEDCNGDGQIDVIRPGGARFQETILGAFVDPKMADLCLDSNHFYKPEPMTSEMRALAEKAANAVSQLEELLHKK